MAVAKLNKFEFLWKVLGGPELEKEYQFEPTRRWRVDYFANGVAIEIEGAIWRGGRHNHPTGFLKDMEKYNRLAEKGILLFRVPAHQITAKWVEPIIKTMKGKKDASI